jgi:multidrug resistance efflux pump
MESTEKKLRGKAIVISLLLAAIVATGVTWLRYTAQAPSTTSARMIRDRVVFATFDAHAARNIGEGTQAIVTFESFDEKRFTGAVQSLKTEDSKTYVVIVLDELPLNVHPQTPCDVTVDTSIARGIPQAD